ncbi:cytochrome P450 [Mycena polygramma]|nr:cytochrome P450 [Mycena polygramma]
MYTMDIDSKTLIVYGLGGALAISWLTYTQKRTIPALGSTGLISSYLTALQLFSNATEMITQGYYQYRDGVFRIPTLFHWDYVANGQKRVLEIAAAPDDILSFQDGVADTLQSDYTLGINITKNPFHISAVRGSLTRNMGRCFPDVHDEIVHAFNHVLGLNDNEWKLIQVLPATMQIVARTSNRLFVGLPLCREPEYLQLNIDYTITIFTCGQLIRLIPEFLKPSLRHALKFVGPLLNERLDKENRYGSNYPGRPGSSSYHSNDLISWLLDLAEGEERTAPALASRLLVTNMAAIHTASTTLTQALYDLAVNPEYILPMREEAERVVTAEGWTKTALNSMHKIDSFLRESQRLRGAAPVAMMRKVVAKDGFKFSDGTTVPYNALLGVAGAPAHYDSANYENANQFDGFRFSRMREEHRTVGTDGDDGATALKFNRHMVSTAHDHVVFGHGHHACPGRFFAATELKAMLAHMLINYDIKAETEGVRPPDICFAMFRMPNPHGKIWIRKRGE